MLVETVGGPIRPVLDVQLEELLAELSPVVDEPVVSAVVLLPSEPLPDLGLAQWAGVRDELEPGPEGFDPAVVQVACKTHDH